MNGIYYLNFIFSVLILTAMPVHALEASNTIQFKGEVIDGPFKDQQVTGVCHRKPFGDRYKQKTWCMMKMRSGYKIVDAKASLEVVGGHRALRIIMGATLNNNHEKGNHKLSAFQVTTFYDRKISLFDLPISFAAVDMSIGGVSVVGGGSTNPDCLIWDIAGDGP